MGQISYEEAIKNVQSGNDSSVGFFSLKNDGNEAIVRLMCDSTADFDIVATHPVGTGRDFRQVNCIRNPHEPMENCPFCAAGMKIQQSIYIRMIEYVVNEQGQIEAQPKVWQRGITYATKLKSFIDNYGPLSNMLFKIVRHGAAGDQKTTYDLIPAPNPQIYNDVNYPKVEDAFEGYSAVGNAVLDKSAEDMVYYAQFGKFPEAEGQQQNAAPQAPVNAAPTGYAPPTPTAGTPWGNDAPAPNPAPTPQAQPGFGGEGMERPIRRY